MMCVPSAPEPDTDTPENPAATDAATDTPSSLAVSLADTATESDTFKVDADTYDCTLMAATLLATALGTLAAVGLARGEFRGKGLVMAVLISPMIAPVVIIAVALYFFFAQLNLLNSYLGLVLAHAALGVPFVVITVAATLQGYDRNFSRAAASLGAPPLLAFRKVMLPLIAPGVISGALFAFATSFDEVVVTLFLASPAQRTLPMQMFGGIRENLNPTIAAAATLMVGASAVLLLLMEWLRRRNEKLRGSSTV